MAKRFLQTIEDLPDLGMSSNLPRHSQRSEESTASVITSRASAWILRSAQNANIPGIRTYETLPRVVSRR
jgi:hypothetical protein